ncbi:hypothetical protein HGRIS_012808 [Hohenbuehelia grisea]|uniref:BRCT domain-containing protein n=1 Tax=Hohenbuehelia grisea TaxID=104357 RepID=A0ABR3ITG3_9AGAR
MQGNDYLDQSSGESQASQTIALALASKSKAQALGRPALGDVTMEDVTTSDVAVLANSQAPKYHYYGLAESQTQTQSCEAEDPDESSQKENLASAEVIEVKAVAHARAKSPRPNVIRTPTKQPKANSRAQQAESSKPKSTPQKGVAFRSPRATPVKAASTKLSSLKTPPPPRRGTYPQVDQFSQDSFARGFDDGLDPGQRYIASSTKFVLPVSQLADEPSDTMSHRPSTSSAYSYRSTLLGRETPEGRVLVESTPSNSEASQSSQEVSQELEPSANDSEAEEVQEAQPQPEELTYSQISDDSAPTLSYQRYINGEQLTPDPGPDPVQATPPQPVLSVVPPASGDMATQPSTQPNSPTCTTQETSAYEPSPALSIPKGMRGLVHPDRPWRIEPYLATRRANEASASAAAAPTISSAMATAGTGAPAAASAEMETQPLDDTALPYINPPQSLNEANPLANSATQLHGDATQPSDAFIPSHIPSGMPETQPSNGEENWVPPPRRTFPPRRTQKTLQPPTFTPESAARSTLDPPDQMEMEVVPDSEPLRAEASTSSSPAKKAPSRRTFLNLSPNPSSEEDSGEIIPDSIIEDEPEENAGEPMDQDVPDDVRERVSSSGQGGVAAAEGNDGIEEDEDDDVPLAAVTSKVNETKKAEKGKGKAAGRSMGPPPAPKAAKGKEKEIYRDTPTPKGKAKATAPADGASVQPSRGNTRRIDLDRSWETGEVPSSAPEQDAVPQPKPVKPPPKQPKNLAPKNATSKAATKVVKRKKKQPQISESEDAESELSDLPDEALVPKVEEDDDDETTEPADNDDYSEDVDMPRKRKRVAKAPTRKRSTKKAKTQQPKSASPVPGPSRQMTRLRSVTVASTRTVLGQPTRVFALWRNDGYYYPGIVHAIRPHGQYHVKFDDSTESDLALDQIRVAELRVDDEVIVADSTRSVKVVDVSQLDEDIVTVLIKGARQEVELQLVKLSNKSAQHAWQDRIPSAESIIPKIQLVTPSPSPSKASIISGTSTRPQSALFEGTGFVITMSATNNNYQKDKAKMQKYIQSHGGTVIDDWSCVLNLDGKHIKSPKRWVIAQKDIGWRGKDVDRVFLLSDDANTKPKYLIAIALGVPCVDTQWVESSVKENLETEWHSFLLSQGFSEALEGRVSQMIDLDWGTDSICVTHIMSNKIPPKIFKGYSVLCLGEDLMPPAPSRGNKVCTR